MSLAELKKIIVSGEMYNDVSPELINARSEAFRLATEYNNSYGRSMEERIVLLKKMLRKVGENVHFEQFFRCEFGFNITIGNNFYANYDCILLDGGEIVIGNNVLFGPRVGIYTSNHAIDAEERIAGGCYSKSVKIGNNVWIGASVVINQGVSIGDNAIIGSGSVVTKDIPGDVVAAGVPCKVIRKITKEDKTGYGLFSKK